MLKRIFTNVYIIVGIIIFLLLFFVGIIWLDFSWGETLLASAALAIVGVGAAWWKNEVWP